jgi:hypothetical protein
LELSRAFGGYYVRLPLTKSAVICHANALTVDWNTVCSANELSHILGNPPFLGKSLMTDGQKKDLEAAIVASDGKSIKGAGNLDFVSAWYYKVAQIMRQNANIRAALVSTNSITQGEQVVPMWKTLVDDYKIKIDFAYRTFCWTSAARGKAAVHCVIVGFSPNTVSSKRRIFDADLEVAANNINSYLIDAPNVYIESRSKPLCNVPDMYSGIKPVDSGFYLFNEEEKNEFIANESKSASLFKLFLGAEEFLKNRKRYYLDVSKCAPSELGSMPSVRERVASVRKFRAASKKEATRRLSETPTLPECGYMPDGNYLLIPCHSSENRAYIPIGFMSKDTIASNACLIVPNATLYHFGILTSNVHMAWVRTICGRLKSDYRYSAGIVYNNFPWPTPTDKQRQAVESAAQSVLTARAQFPRESLATLYDPTLMPPALAKAHKSLDTAVKNAYGSKGFASEAERVADLMERYVGLVGG